MSDYKGDFKVGDKVRVAYATFPEHPANGFEGTVVDPGPELANTQYLSVLVPEVDFPRFSDGADATGWLFTSTEVEHVS